MNGTTYDLSRDQYEDRQQIAMWLVFVDTQLGKDFERLGHQLMLTDEKSTDWYCHLILNLV